jgi:hypothetical protein
MEKEGVDLFIEDENGKITKEIIEVEPGETIGQAISKKRPNAGNLLQLVKTKKETTMAEMLDYFKRSKSETMTIMEMEGDDTIIAKYQIIKM